MTVHLHSAGTIPKVFAGIPSIVGALAPPRDTRRGRPRPPEWAGRPGVRWPPVFGSG